MKSLIYYGVQWSWGLLQNVAGLALYLKHKDCERTRYRENVVTYWNLGTGLSLGMFTFLPVWEKDKRDSFLLKHEAGHAIQSMILGPFYFLVIGAPSYAWCNIPMMEKLRKKLDIDYYDFFTERWANNLAGICKSEDS